MIKYKQPLFTTQVIIDYLEHIKDEFHKQNA